MNIIPPNSTPRQTLSVEEAATALGIGRTTAYQAIRRGELPVLRIGRRLVVPRAALERLLASDAAPALGDAQRPFGAGR